MIVASAMGPADREHLIETRPVAVGELERDPREVFLEMRDTARARDRDHVLALVKRPRDGQTRRR